jgi:hypothetical protein
MTEAQAKSRFLMIQLVRLTGVAMVLIGLLIALGKVNVPSPAGFVLIGAGMIETFVLPMLLARGWKTPSE